MGFLKKLGGKLNSIFNPRQSDEVLKARFPPAKKSGTSWSQEFTTGNNRARKKINDAWDDLANGIKPARGTPDPAIAELWKDYPDRFNRLTVDQADWHNLISSNVERIRYGEDDRALQVVFKNGSIYQYEDVEPEIFAGFLHTHSPGQYVHYVLIAYGYPYAKLGGGEGTTAPAAPRYTGEVFGVPKWIEDVQAKAGRRATEDGVAAPAPPGSPPGKTVPFNEKIPPLPWK